MSASVIRGGGRPNRYKLASGKVVPSVTTITKRFQDSAGLIRWAWNEGREGRSLEEKRDHAAEVGAWVHDMIEAGICGEGWAPPGWSTEADRRAAETAYTGFVRWFAASGIDVTHTEMPLVSEAHAFGGTLDAIGRGEDGLVLLDWKSGAGVYVEHLIQVSAYVMLWEELHPADRFETIHLLRVGKEYGDFHHHSWPRRVVAEGWDSFLMMRRLYALDGKLRALVK